MITVKNYKEELKGICVIEIPEIHVLTAYL